ncbi:MAG: T9SS type A sorting domain-containing protein [Bacteroidota bacterium]
MGTYTTLSKKGTLSKIGMICLLDACFCLIALPSFSQTVYYTRQSGKWSDINTWSATGHSGAVATVIPGQTKNTLNSIEIVIAAGHNVILDSDRQVGALTIGADAGAGKLTFGDSKVGRSLVVNGTVKINWNGIIERNLTKNVGLHQLKITGSKAGFINDGQVNFADFSVPRVAIPSATVDVVLEASNHIEMTGAASAQNCLLNSLLINTKESEVLLGSTWNIARQLYIKSGALILGDAINQYTLNGSTSSAKIQMDSDATLRIFSSSSFPSGFQSKIQGENGTVEYAGGNQNIAFDAMVESFENLILTGNGSKFLTSNVVVNKKLIIHSKANLSTGMYQLDLKGNFTNLGVFTPGSSFVRFSGNTTQTIDGTADITMANLEINKSNGNILLLNNLSVSKVIKFIKGNIENQSSQLKAGAGIEIIRQSGHVIGHFSREVGATPSFFPVGTKAYYLPLTINFTKGTSEVTATAFDTNPAEAKGLNVQSNPLSCWWSMNATEFPEAAEAKVTFEYPNEVRPNYFQQDIAFADRWNTQTNGWQSFEAQSTSSPDLDPSTVTVNGITELADWTIFHSNVGMHVPITLLNFAGQLVDGGMGLEWSTASEIDNASFVIERSIDARHFEAIGEVQGAGNSREKLQYNFLDRNASKGITYYRLKQLNVNGLFEYSKTISVEENANTLTYAQAKFSVFPNPSNGSDFRMNVSGLEGQEATFKMVDAHGIVVATQVLNIEENSQTISFEQSNMLKTGLYVAVLQVGSYLISERMVVR